MDICIDASFDMNTQSQEPETRQLKCPFKSHLMVCVLAKFNSSLPPSLQLDTIMDYLIFYA